MKDLHSIIKAVRTDPKLADSAVLVTLVRVSGSFYRHPGARMLITAYGDIVGTVSGGCLENDLIKKAKQVIESGKPKLFQYSTEHPESHIGRALKGCGGDVEVLIEPFGKELFELLDKCLNKSGAEQCTSAMATVIDITGTTDVRAGDRIIVRDDNIQYSDISDTSIMSDIRRGMKKIMGGGSLLNKTYTKNAAEIEVFIEPFQSPNAVLLIGAGDVARSIAAIADELGWSTTVVDHRQNASANEQFLDAECIALKKPSELSERVRLDRIDAAVVLTHICEADMEYVRQLLESEVQYIGLLGSRNRVTGLLDFLENEGVSKEEIAARVYGPVGLDIGSETPAEIALSIVSEIQSTLAGGTTRSLKTRARRTQQEA